MEPANRPEPAYWRGRRVLVTGHTGFKGAWLTRILHRWGAAVAGIALPPATSPSLFALLSPWPGIESRMLDIRDAGALRAAVLQIAPQVVFHLAAQPLVRASYREPVATIATNVLGTAHLLAALAGVPSLRAVLVVTSDKVYRNSDRGEPFAEDAALGGDDPYSASKACTEIVAQSWRSSGLLPAAARLATARAGNVIGGGDYADDRLLPDVVRAIAAGTGLTLRAPQATRPWQHVLDVCEAYLLYAEALAERGPEPPTALNIGPVGGESRSVIETVQAFLQTMGADLPVGIVPAPEMPEKTRLALDPGRAMRALGWRPRLGFAEAIAWTGQWYRNVLRDPGCAARITDAQIDAYFEGSPCRPLPSTAAAAPLR